MKIITLALLCLSFMTFAAEKDQDYQTLLNAMPEIAQPSEQTKSSNAAMKCYVDTPAYDNYSYGQCFSAGWAFTTTAVFKIDNVPSNFTILWSNSSCSQSSVFCNLPIRQYQHFTLSATVLDNSNNTFTTTSATAWYEGFQ